MNIDDIIKTKKESGNPKTLFDKEDIESIVKGFIRAHLSGQIKINFIHAGELIVKPEYQSIFKTDYKKALDDENRGKTIFNKYVSICSGAIKTTQSEYDYALNELFQWILALKAGNRIDGKFYEYDVEKRLEKIEDKYIKSIDLLKKEVRWLKEQSGI